MPTIVIRADASRQIGTGHVIRCLVLADLLHARGADCSFICSPETPQTAPLLTKSSYRCISPDDPNFFADLLIIDHYSLDAEYTKRARTWAKKIAIIDDINVSFHDCDALISQNPVFEKEDYTNNVSSHALGFYGPEYLLIRPEFLAARKTSRPRNVPPKNILLFFGGTDVGLMTVRILEIFRGMSYSGTLTVVAGAANPDLDRIKILSHELGADLHIQTDKMHILMQEADVAISCGGTAIWERLALRLPTIEITHSDFQIPVLKQLDRAGYLSYVGHNKNLSDQDIEYAIKKAVSDGLSIRPCVCGTKQDEMADRLITLAKEGL